MSTRKTSSGRGWLGMESQSMPSRSSGREPLMNRRNCGGSSGSTAPPSHDAGVSGGSSATAWSLGESMARQYRLSAGKSVNGLRAQMVPRQDVVIHLGHDGLIEMPQILPGLSSAVVLMITAQTVFVIMIDER